MSLSSFPACVSALNSRAIPAVQSRSLVVAVVRLHAAECHGWSATLAVGPKGGVCRPVAWVSVSGRTRAQARNSAVELARRYARAPSSLPASALPAPLTGPPLVRERPAYFGAPGAHPQTHSLPAEPLEHVEIETLPAGGFLLTLTGGGFDGTCVVVPPSDAATWQVVEDLCGLLGVPASASASAREAHLHAELLRLLHARAVRSGRRPLSQAA